MNELYQILEEKLQIRYETKAILTLLETLEGAYSEEKEPELKSVVYVTKIYLKSLYESINSAIEKMDTFLVEEAQRKKVIENGGHF